MAGKVSFSQLWEEEENSLRKWSSSLGKDSIIVEIGTAQGGSAYLFATSAREKSISVYSYDICQSQEAFENLRGLDVQMISNASVDGAGKWMRSVGMPIDLLFIDGSHTLENVFNDLLSWFPHVREGGVILFHDYDPIYNGGASHLGVKVFVDALMKQEAFEAVERVGRILTVRKVGTSLEADRLIMACGEVLKEIKEKISRAIGFDYRDCTYFALDEGYLAVLRRLKGLQGTEIASLQDAPLGGKQVLIVPSPALAVEVESMHDSARFFILDDLSFFYLVEDTIKTDRDSVLAMAKDRATFFKWEEALEMHEHSRSTVKNEEVTCLEEPGISAVSRECAFELVRINILRNIYSSILGVAR